jgi:hypothetical protein
MLHNPITAYRLSKMMMMNMKIVDHFFVVAAKLGRFSIQQNFISVLCNKKYPLCGIALSKHSV